MYLKFAEIYDKIYAAKAYAAECETLMGLIRRHGQEIEGELLDVACGTGQHIAHLRDQFDCTGLDLSEAMLRRARERNPGVPFHQGDMARFDLGHSFDVVLCLFGSLGYTRTLARTRSALKSMCQHLRPGGLLIVEPWLTPQAWSDGSVHGVYVDEPELKIARLSTSLSKGPLAVLDMHFLVATPQGTEYFAEQHELLLLPREKLHALLEAEGLGVAYEEEGLIGRGLFMAQKPIDARQIS